MKTCSPVQRTGTKSFSQDCCNWRWDWLLDLEAKVASLVSWSCHWSQDCERKPFPYKLNLYNHMNLSFIHGGLKMESICCGSDDTQASLRDGRSQSYVQRGATPTPRNRPSSPLPVWRACSCCCRDGHLSPGHCQDKTAAARTGKAHLTYNIFCWFYMTLRRWLWLLLLKQTIFNFQNQCNSQFDNCQFVTHLRFVFTSTKEIKYWLWLQGRGVGIFTPWVPEPKSCHLVCFICFWSVCLTSVSDPTFFPEDLSCVSLANNYDL